MKTTNAASESLTWTVPPTVFGSVSALTNPVPIADSHAGAPANGADQKLYIGIDNGSTGALAGLYPMGKILYRPTEVMRLGKEKLLDVERNLESLNFLINQSGQPLQNVLVVFEQGQIAPKFGAKNNYTNGKNNEFWRVLLTTSKIPFTWVNPKVWQQVVFRGIRGDDTKEMAELVRRQRFPGVDLKAFNQIERQGINDAIGIALWARQTAQ